MELRILILEDEPEHAVLVERALRKARIAFSSQRVDTMDGFTDALETFRPDIILADYELRGFTGSDALRAARRSHPEIPAIVVTGALGDEKAVELLRDGAKDYVLKDRLARLGPAIRRVLDAERTERQRRAAEAAVRASELRYRRLFESARDGIVIIDAESGRIFDANPFMLDLLGRSHAACVGKQLWDIVPAAAADAARDAFEQLQRDGSYHSEDLPLAAPSGAPIAVEFLGNVFETDGARVIQCNFRDIRERRQAQEKIHRLNNLYNALSRTNNAIVRCSGEADLFAQVCRIAVDCGGFRSAWIGMLDAPGGEVVPEAIHGAGTEFIRNLKVSADPGVDSGRGPGGVALREGRHSICADVASDPQAAPWAEQARAAGVVAAAAFPLHRFGAIAGVFIVYADDDSVFAEDLIQLLDEMATDISFALDKLAGDARRRHAEQQLLESETRLRLAIAASRQGIFDLNVVTGEVAYSAEYMGMLGYEASAWHESHDRFLERLLPDDRDAWRVARDACLEGRQPEFPAEFRIQAADGGWRWILAMGAVVERDDEGRPLRFIGTHTDISERKSSEEKMRLMASVFEHSQEVIVITDAALNIVDVNKAFTDTTGYAASAVIGKNVSVVKPAQEDQAFHAAMWKQVSEVGSWQGEVWNRRRNGERYPTLSAISAVHDAKGRLTHYVDISADITEHKQAEARIRHLAYYDALTGLPNRALLQDRVTQALAKVQRDRSELALLFLDLDRFKNINDSLGHVVGDRLLQVVPSRIRQVIRDADTVGRLGGDEFLILIPMTDAHGAARIAQKLQDVLAEPYEVNGHSLRVTPSIGISLYPKDGTSFDELLKNADAAMYRAKDQGRNTYRFFTPEMNARAFERLYLENALRLAVGRNEFNLYFQPQVKITGSGLIGFEALIRWRHPELGEVSPEKFIPIAEDSGLIEPIGAWVLQEACRQNRLWHQNGMSPVMAVNLSTRQFSLENITKVVADVLDNAGSGASDLEIEITESLLVQDVKRTLGQLKELKSMGVQIAVDDFGTGYSSLSYLKRFPLDKLKIDQSFVSDLVENKDDRAIAAAVINLGHSLDLTVVAEGVESRAQLDILRELGCDGAQGFLFGRPGPAAAMHPYLPQWEKSGVTSG